MVIGLGNPGVEYAGTRHNLGFCVIDSLGSVLNMEVRRRKFGAVFGEGEIFGRKLILLKPWRYMNVSGQVVASVMGFYKLDIGDLLVVTDDMSLLPGMIRIRSKGSSGGHNGLSDVIDSLGTEEIGRLRIGIGQSEAESAEEYVLKKPSKSERPLLEKAVEKARDAVLCWIECGIDEAMNRFNE